METCEQPILANFEDTLRSLALGYPASRPPLPGSAEAHAMTVGSGRQCAMLLEESSPLGYCSRILLGSSLWTSSEEYCYVWERLDTRFECSAFQLIALEPNTEDNGSSLWRTPNTFDHLEAKSQEALDHEQEVTNSGVEPNNLRDQAAVRAGLRLWRTPDANMDRTGMDGEKRLEAGHALSLNDQVKTPKLWPTPRANKINGKDREDFSPSLHNAAKLWPTPTGRDWKDGEDGENVPVNGLLGRAVNPSPSQGSLNPRFVEELMGYPIDHTALKRSATPSFPSKPVRSLKRSPKSKDENP